ncbi:glycoside hydrolase family 5 protein [Clostridium bornimense]|uniref:glycoside hydrolase family 5 protein n=1 Tax=Clostridium bornimense TaxID=1216932 RepID=UPI001C10663D|nr:glycoside hydrolase family 5 protein [Clostridium bornimense]MBU5316224.1 glycoside hydrolase family 5 protein [Clostridium bornimense]
MDKFKSSKEIVNSMGVGWNLGNSLDSYSPWITSNNPTDYEMSWGNPVTTKAMIDKVVEGGFRTIRIPVTWDTHIGEAPDYKINDAWMKRVKEVVNYAISNNVYVILNLHHEDNWLIPSLEKEAEVTNKLEKIWFQIAYEFINYNDHLLFESFNEVREKGSPLEWMGGTKEGRAIANRYNATAVKTIRNTGGNNSKRSILIPTYAASGSYEAIKDLIIPNSKNIIVSIHDYFPYNFAMNCSDEYATDKWGSIDDKKELIERLNSFYYTFVLRGIPVIIGEFGSTNKDNLSYRVEHAKSFISYAKKRHIGCIWWDNNSNSIGAENFGLFDRDALNWYHPEIHNALINSYNNTSI